MDYTEDLTHMLPPPDVYDIVDRREWVNTHGYRTTSIDRNCRSCVSSWVDRGKVYCTRLYDETGAVNGRVGGKKVCSRWEIDE